MKPRSISRFVKIEAAIAGRHLVNAIWIKPQRLRKQVEGLFGVSVGIIGGHKSLVSPPELHAGPVDG